MLAITSPKLTALVLLVVPLVVVPIVGYGRRVRRLSRESQDRIADVSAFSEETLNALRTVQAYTHEEIESTRFNRHVESAFKTAVARISARALLTAIVIVMVFGAVGTILWIGGHDVLDGVISAGELSAFVFYAVVVAGSVGAISEVIGDLQRAAGAAERLVALLETEPKIAAPENPVALPVPHQGHVSFEDVTFHYPARPDRSALEGLIGSTGWLRWWGRQGPEKPRYSSCCSDSMIRRRELFVWMVLTCARPTRLKCVNASVWWRRTR